MIFTCVSSSDTSAILKQTKELPTGVYSVPIDVKDLQGYGKTQTAKIRICQCKNGVCPAKQSSVTLGPLALLAMLLPLALLLLLCESLTVILLPAESCRLHCTDNETRILHSCSANVQEEWYLKLHLSLNYALYIGNRAVIHAVVFHIVYCCYTDAYHTWNTAYYKIALLVHSFLTHLLCSCRFTPHFFLCDKGWEAWTWRYSWQWWNPAQVQHWGQRGGSGMDIMTPWP